MKKILLCLLLFTLILGGCGANPSAAPSSSGNVVDYKYEIKNNPVTVAFETESNSVSGEDETKILDSYCDIPSISIDNNKESENSIHSHILSLVNHYHDTMKSFEADAKRKYMHKNFSPISFYQKYASSRADERVISLISTTTTGTGISGLTEEVTGLNFDTKTGRILKLESICKNKEILLRSVKDYIVSIASDNFYADTFNWSFKDAIAGFLTDSYWYFSQGGLSFIAPPSTNGMNSKTSIVFTVPYDELKGLKKAYAYYGNYQRTAIIGSKITRDLDADGMEETLSYDVSEDQDGTVLPSLAINGKDFTNVFRDFSIYLTNNYCPAYTLIDLDVNDHYVELAISDYGPSNDSVTYFFRYDSNSLRYLGCVGDLIDSGTFEAKGDGLIKADLRLSLLQTSWSLADYRLNRDGTISLIPAAWYEPSVYAGEKNNGGHEILTSVWVYKEADRSSGTLLLSSQDGPVFFPATDNKNWVQAETQTGDTYYLYMKDFSTIVSGDNEVDAQKVFGNLCLVD